MFGFSLDKNTAQSSAPSMQQAANYRKLRGQKYNENHQRILTCIFEGITTRLYGITFNLTCSPQNTKWFEELRHNVANPRRSYAHAAGTPGRGIFGYGNHGAAGPVNEPELLPME